MSIAPFVDLSPRVFPIGQRASALLTITNQDLASGSVLNRGDAFAFAFDLPWGGPVALAGPVLVNSQTFLPSEFAAGARGGVVTLTHIGEAKIMPRGDAVSVLVDFLAPPAVSAGKIAASGPH